MRSVGGKNAHGFGHERNAPQRGEDGIQSICLPFAVCGRHVVSVATVLVRFLAEVSLYTSYQLRLSLYVHKASNNQIQTTPLRYESDS